MTNQRGSCPAPSLAALALGAACALAPAIALGQRFETRGVNLQKVANGVLSMMGFMLTPDVTTGSLSFSNDATGNPDFGMTSLGGGFTMSERFPLYLEGTAGYSRYDPTFIASDGQEERPVTKPSGRSVVPYFPPLVPVILRGHARARAA